MKQITEQEWSCIGSDLQKCDMMEALGTPYYKRKARKHKKMILQAISHENEIDGLNNKQTDEELLANLRL